MSDKKIIHILRIIDLGRGAGLGHIKRTNNLLVQMIFKNKKVRTESAILERDDSKIDLLHTPDIIIIDSYKMSQERIDRLMETYPDAVHFIIDDFNRLSHYKCDFLLNYNPLAHNLNYSTAYHTQRLFGLEYFPISNELKKARKIAAYREKIEHILVTMGGVDPSNFTEVVCNAFLEGFEDYTFHIVIGSGFKNKNRMIRRYKGRRNYKFYQDLADLAPLMAKSDFAISSAGVTSYELAYLGKPAILIPISKDQVLNAKSFRDMFSFVTLDFSSIRRKDEITKRLRDFFDKITQNKKLRGKIISELEKGFKPKDNNLPEILMTRLNCKMLRKKNPIKISCQAEVCREYDISLRKEKEYEKVRWGSRAGMINRFKLAHRLLSTIKYESLLDVGCGTGDIFKVIMKRKKKYFAYDLNFNMVSYAKKNSNSSVRYFNASSRVIPVKSNAIDVVTLIGVLQNCGIQVNEFIKEVSRIIKTKGHIFIITKNLGWYKFVKGDLKPEIGHNWFFDYEISEELEKNGFDIIDKSGFLNRNGKLVDIDKSHEIFYWARKN